jgi:hypothetical protein
MGHPRPDAEKEYLEMQLGHRWQRLLSNSQIFNWFADYATQESKIDRDKIVKRLRVFSSRDETPTAFWTVLMTKFYEEGAHLGLRKYAEDGVTYHCPPQYFMDFKALCQSTPSYKNTILWVFRPDYLNGWIFAHVFCAGNNNWFKKSWPDALKLQGRRYLISYYRAGTVHELSDTDGAEFDEASLESYRSSHSLLCLIFGTRSRAAFDISLGDFASRKILEVVNDPYLGVSSPGFGDAALSIAALCVKRGKNVEKGKLKREVLDLLENLGKNYPQLESAMIEDADYMHLMTYPLMPLSKKSGYGAVMADFEAGMKGVVIENAEEITALARRLEGQDEELCLNVEREDPEDSARYPIEVVRQYLASARIQNYMPIEGFDTLLQMSERMDGEPSDIVQTPTLKRIIREQFKKLTEHIEATGEFLITGPLMIALIEVGQVCCDCPHSDYGDLIFRTESDRPWLRTSVKFAGEIDRLDDVRREFRAFCRIITRK